MFKKIIEGIFTPAVKIMSLLRYWQKFVLITILFTIPVSFALYSFISEINERITSTEKEISGTHYIAPVFPLLQDVQQHRGMASLYLRGDESLLPLLAEKEKKIEEDFALVNAKDQEFGTELGTVDTLNALQRKWTLLERNYLQLSSKESAQQHTELISDILAFIHLIGDRSNLTLDPDLDSFYLMNTVVNTLPSLAENIGQARAFTLSITDPKKISDLERRDIINFTKINSIAEDKIQRDIHVAFEANNSLEANLGEPLNSLTSSLRSFSSLLDTFVNTNAIEMSLPEYYAFSTAIINTNFSFLASLSSSLHDLLHHRIEWLQKEKQISIAIAVLSYLLILYFFIGFYLLVVRTVRGLENIAKQLTSGKVEEVSALSNDELGDVAESFNLIGRALVVSNNENREKSAELHTQLDELERFNKLMIGRELKMVELKKENKELKEKLGGPTT